VRQGKLYNHFQPFTKGLAGGDYMTCDISTWEQLLASGLPATERTLELFTTYELLTQIGEGWKATGRMMFYSGIFILERTIPPIRCIRPYEVQVGETVVTVANLGSRQPFVVVRPAVIYGIVDPDMIHNPSNYTLQYACVRLDAMPELRRIRAESKALTINT
jgi:hypothetical protein